MPKLSTGPIKGMLTSPRRTGTGEAGWLFSAKNVLLRDEGVVQPRFGLEATTPTTSGVDRMFYDPVNEQVLRASAKTEDVLEKLSGTAWTSLDSSRRYSSGVADRNFFFLLSDEGLRRVDSGNTTTEIAFVPEGLDVSDNSANTAHPTPGWQPNDSQVSYRVVFGIKNSQNEFFLGAPGGRLIMTNDSGSTRDNSLRLTLASDITTNHFIQIYRTRPSAAATIDPGDEHFLIWEDFPASGDVSNGYYDFIDRVPDLNGGPSLYTNESQQTDQQGNHPCEAATGTNGEGTLAAFAECLWATNHQPRSSLEINILSVLTETGLYASTFTADTNSDDTLTSVSSFDGIAVGQRLEGTDIPAGTNISSFDSGAGTITMDQSATGTTATVTVTFGDRLTIAGDEYVAWTAEDTTADEFLVSTDSSAAKAIRLTAESLVRVINRSSSNAEIYARYLSGPNELPGRILITARTDRASTYTAQAHSHGTGFFPNLEEAQTILSKGESDFLLYSKPREPQAWPLLNFLQIGNDAEVLDITALRAALLVWTDRGVYRVTGVYGNFGVDLIDASTILARTSTNPGLGTVVIDNVAYGYTNKGLVAATESGTTVVSQAIGDFVENVLIGEGRLSQHYGDRMVLLPLDSDTWVYHADNGMWTFLDVFYKAGAYDFSSRRLVLHDTSDTSHRMRDQTYAVSSLFDTASAVTINSTDTSANTLTLASAPSGWAAGDTILQGVETQTILSIAGAVATVTDASAFSTGAATVDIGYDCAVVWNPMGAPSPSVTKHLRYTNAVLDGGTVDTADPGGFTDLSELSTRTIYTASWATDIDSTRRTESETVVHNDYPHLARFVVPQESSRCSVVSPGVSWRQSGRTVRLVGLEIDYEPVSDKTRR